MDNFKKFNLAKNLFNLLTKHVFKHGKPSPINEDMKTRYPEIINWLSVEGYEYSDIIEQEMRYKKIDLKEKCDINTSIYYCYKKRKPFIKAFQTDDMLICINEEKKSYKFFHNFENEKMIEDGLLKLSNIIHADETDIILKEIKELYGYNEEDCDNDEEAIIIDASESPENIGSDEKEEYTMKNYELPSFDFEDTQNQIDSASEMAKGKTVSVLEMVFDEETAVTFIKKFINGKGEEKERDSKINIDLDKASRKYTNGLTFDLEWYKNHIDNVMLFCDQVKFNIGNLKIKLFKDRGFYNIKLINGKKEICLKIKNGKSVNKISVSSIKECNNRKMVKFVMTSLQLVGVLIK